MSYRSVFYIILVLLFGCNAKHPYVSKKTVQVPNEQSKIKTQLLLIGDAGEPKIEGKDPVFSALTSTYSDYNSNDWLVFLGDNIYYNGLPDTSHEDYEKSKKKIDVQLAAAKQFPGNVAFIPGNHDWHRGKEDGIQWINRQEKYIRDQAPNIKFIPSSGCPGPEWIALGDNAGMIIFDSQWWLHRFQKGDSCATESEEDFIGAMEQLMEQNRGKNIFVIAHHPLYSYGKHGGYFSLKDHLFPLTAKFHKLYFPFPVIGSIYPMYRKYFGNIQDIPHPKYKELKVKLTTLFKKYDHVTYICGHEHNLQHHIKDGVDYLVSGSGSKHSHLRKKRKAQFLLSKEGFMKLDVLENNAVNLTTFAVDNAKANAVYQAQIEQSFNIEKFDEKKAITGSDTVIPYEKYEAGFLKKLILGKHYRPIWTTPIVVPYLDLVNEKGGLTPLRKGGGQQTLSLRMQGGNGYQYALRSIEKFPEKALPEKLKKTVANDVVKDQIAASHPYGALAVPRLAEAAGVYHTNPRLVILPDHPALGTFREEFKNRLMLFEERPDDDMSEFASFGNSQKVASTPKMIYKVLTKNNHEVDQKAFLNARLFDMFVGDWDRHDDQWRWATFKKDGKTIYKPIPRDRDQVFFHFRGILPSIANRKWALRKFQHFNHDIRDIAGMNFNGRYIDRDVLTELEKEEWIEVARTLQANLNDEVIEKALSEGYFLYNREIHEEIISKLKSRRDKLVEFAERYYAVLAKSVTVTGTEKSELFQITRKEGATEVKIFDLKKGKKGSKTYDRTFRNDETKEIVIHLIGGKNEVKWRGNVKKGPKIRVVGSIKKDDYDVKSTITQVGNRNRIYENLARKNSYSIKSDKGLKQVKFLDDSIYTFKRRSFHYDLLGPAAYFGFNPDDGVFFGGGVQYVKYGFNKEPYSSNQKLLLNRATLTNATNTKYEGDFIGLVGRVNLKVYSHFFAPNYVSNFYGFGNETDRLVEDFDFYRIRLQQFYQELFVYKTKKKLTYGFGPTYRFASLDQLDKTFSSSDVSITSQPQFNQLNTVEFDEQSFIGARARLSIDDRNNKFYPERGVLFNLSAFYEKSFIGQNHEYLKLESDFSIYKTFSPFTLAFRVGGGHNFGSFRFYQANAIGGLREMRGTNRDRYTGRSKVYQNFELRAKLISVNNYVMPFSIGGLALSDVARVFADGEDSQLYHFTYGGGVFIDFLDTIIISYTIANNLNEERSFQNLMFGFMF